MRYLVFIFGEYYPFGGMGDLKMRTDDKEKAILFLKDRRRDIPGDSYGRDAKKIF